MSTFYSRDMVVRILDRSPSPNRGPEKVWSYSVNPAMRGEYELLPVQTTRLMAKRTFKKGVEPCTTTKPELAPELLPNVSPIPVAATGVTADAQAVEKVIADLSLLKAQLLYVRLKEIFQP